MTIDKAQLKALAEAATPGKWVTDGEYVNEHGNVLYAYVAHEKGGRIAEAFANCLVKTDEQCRANAAYIAAASPTAVLALLAEIERLKADNRSLRGSCAKTGSENAGLSRQLKKATRQSADARAELAGLRTGYEAQNNVIAELKAENEALRSSSSCVEDLSALVRQLVHRLRKASPDNDLPEKALDYLRRKGLQGSPLRNERDKATEHEAQKIYESWSGQDGFVPWVVGGNSDKQDEARRLARAAMAKEASHG